MNPHHPTQYGTISLPLYPNGFRVVGFRPVRDGDNGINAMSPMLITRGYKDDDDASWRFIVVKDSDAKTK